MPPRALFLSRLTLGLIGCLTVACASVGGGVTSSVPASAGGPPQAVAIPLSGTVVAASTPAQDVPVAVESGDPAVPAGSRETTPDRTRRESVPTQVREIR